MQAKRLIVNADDYGMSRGITDGIIRAHREGIVTSTSLMVNQPASEYAVAQLFHTPKLGVGVHLNIGEGNPILPPEQVPSLVNGDGSFHSPDRMIRKLWRFEVSSQEIEAEFRAQVRWMKDRGITPTHADSHRHMHVYPAAVLPFRRALLKEGVCRMRGTRHRPSPNRGVVGGPYAGSLPRRLATGMYSEFLQGIVLKRFFSPDSCIVQHPRFRGKLELIREGWRAIVENLPDGSYEIGCHPGFYEAGFSDGDDIRERREIELDILTERKLRSLIQLNRIELIAYPQL